MVQVTKKINVKIIFLIGIIFVIFSNCSQEINERYICNIVNIETYYKSFNTWTSHMDNRILLFNHDYNFTINDTNAIDRFKEALTQLDYAFVPSQHNNDIRIMCIVNCRGGISDTISMGRLYVRYKDKYYDIDPKLVDIIESEGQILEHDKLSSNSK